MRGFQLWINLPAKEKMKPARYQDIQSDEIPLLNLPDGGEIKVIAGCAEINGNTIHGPIQGLSTQPLFLDIRLPAHSQFFQPIAEVHKAFVYPYQGKIEIGTADQFQTLASQMAGVLSDGERSKFAPAISQPPFCYSQADHCRNPSCNMDRL